MTLQSSDFTSPESVFYITLKYTRKWICINSVSLFDIGCHSTSHVNHLTFVCFCDHGLNSTKFTDCVNQLTLQGKWAVLQGKGRFYKGRFYKGSGGSRQNFWGPPQHFCYKGIQYDVGGIKLQPKLWPCCLPQQKSHSAGLLSETKFSKHLKIFSSFSYVHHNDSHVFY